MLLLFQYEETYEKTKQGPQTDLNATMTKRLQLQSMAVLSPRFLCIITYILQKMSKATQPAAIPTLCSVITFMQYVFSLASLFSREMI